MTVDEFAENYSNFRSKESPIGRAPEGFFLTKSLSELVDFWSLKTTPSRVTQ